MDSNFILVEEVDDRLEAINEIYTTSFKNNAIRLLNKYSVDYIVVTEKAKEIYGISELKYLDENCFKTIYDDKVKILNSLCKVEEK